MKRSRLTWWEDATIAVCVWLATWLSLLLLRRGASSLPPRGRSA